MVRELLHIAYERELELEELIDRTNSENKWFFEETRKLNIEIQNKCLEKLGKQRKVREHKESLH